MNDPESHTGENSLIRPSELQCCCHSPLSVARQQIREGLVADYCALPVWGMEFFSLLLLWKFTENCSDLL